MSRDAVPKPLCQRCYQEMDNVSLLQCLENIERETVSAITESSENQPHEQEELLGPLSAQRLGIEQRREFGDLAEYAATQDNFLVDNEGILRYSERD